LAVAALYWPIGKLVKPEAVDGEEVPVPQLL
jgi:hypothetical protein